MPELPEVQTIVNGLNAAGLPGCRIIGADVRWPKTVAVSGSPEKFSRLLTGKAVSAIGRRGKYITIELTQKYWLLIHLRMTGRLELSAHCGPSDPHCRVMLSLDDGRYLKFNDTRKFGRFYLTTDPGAITRTLGPEPLDPGFTAKVLADRLQGRRRQIKPLLLDQSFLAGLGNIYVDEALWLACLHPLRSADTLERSQIKCLHRAIRGVLRQGIRNNGTSLGSGKGNFISPQRNQGRNASRLEVFRRTGQPCGRCGLPIKRIVVGQRSTHICTKCQQLI